MSGQGRFGSHRELRLQELLAGCVFKVVAWLQVLKQSKTTLFCINPYLTSGLVHPYHLDEFISSFRGFLLICFIFAVFCIAIPVRKQC